MRVYCAVCDLECDARLVPGSEFEYQRFCAEGFAGAWPCDGLLVYFSCPTHGDLVFIPSPERATVRPSPMRPSAAQPVTEDPLRDAHEDRRSARNVDPTPLDKDGQAAGGIGQGGDPHGRA